MFRAWEISGISSTVDVIGWFVGYLATTVSIYRSYLE